MSSSRAGEAGTLVVSAVRRFARSDGGAFLLSVLPLVICYPLWAEVTKQVDPRSATWESLATNPLIALALLVPAVLYGLVYLWKRNLLGRPVYMLEISPFRPPDNLMVTWKDMLNRSKTLNYSAETELFQQRIAVLSGVGPETFVSPALKRLVETGEQPTSMYAACIEEAEMVMYSVAEDVLTATGIHPEEVDVVITTSTIFAPTPTMSAMIINRFKMRDDVIGYSLAGQGCSSGVVCTELTNQILQGMANKVVLVVAHENITPSFYEGHQRSFLISNLLFRAGGAAALFSNRPRDRKIAKYQLTAHARVHHARHDASFQVIQGKDDPDGVRGIYLSRNILPVSSAAIQQNLRRMAIKALPVLELLKADRDPKYTPNFKKAFNHFLIHTGSKTVIDSVADKLSLSEKARAPSAETLWFYGNTCVASTYYILANVETKVGIKKGEQFLQLGFGTGFKCVSAAWVALRDVNTQHKAWTFPVNVAMPPGAVVDKSILDQIGMTEDDVKELGDAFKILEKEMMEKAKQYANAA